MMMRNQPAPAVTLGTAVTGVGAGRTEEHSGAWAHSDRHGSQPRHRRGDRPAPAQRGRAVPCTFLRVDDPDDPGTPQEYRDHRAQDAAAVVGRIRDGGGKAAAVEADLSDPATPGKLFDAAEEQFGPGEPPEPSVQARDAGPGSQTRRMPQLFRPGASG